MAMGRESDVMPANRPRGTNNVWIRVIVSPDSIPPRLDPYYEATKLRRYEAK